MNFKRGADGRMLFFPWGLFGRGYVLESEERHARLRRQINVSLVAYLVLTTFGWVAYGPSVGIAAAAVLCMASGAWLFRYTRRLEASDERPSVLDGWRRQAGSSRVTTLWIVEILGCLMVLAATYVLAGAQDWRGWLTGGAGIVFFGMATAASTYMIVVKHRAR